MSDTTNEYLTTLQTRFKYPAFREKQLDIIRAILEDKRDICVTMFTGAGKSLCYQFPAVHTNKIALVVSPLIALMNDQAIKLGEQGISATCLNSSVSKKKIEKNILEGKFNIVYTTPEYIVEHEEFIKEIDKTGKLVVVAIDESHCVSMWGNDFREAYLKLGVLKQWLVNCPLISLTATATTKVENDIMTTLQLTNPLIIRTTFDRPNLFIKVVSKTTMADPIATIASLINDEPSIVYCQTRKDTETISEQLKTRGVKCDTYHAGMDNMERECVHEEFIHNKITTVVATVAFGMGIDKVIRNIVHYGTPQDMESYYQEIGRAGRDFKQSKCVLIYSKSDMPRMDYFISTIKNQVYKRHKTMLGAIMRNYVYTTGCRRKIILSYFGEKFEATNCGMCDNCKKGKDVIVGSKNKVDATIDSTNLLKTVMATGNMYGSTAIIGLLRGSKAKTAPPKFYTLPTYGIGHSKPDSWWKTLIRLCINEQLLQEVPISKMGYTGSSLKVTDTGKEACKPGGKVLLDVAGEGQQFTKYLPKEPVRTTVTQLPIPTEPIALEDHIDNLLEMVDVPDSPPPVVIKRKKDRQPVSKLSTLDETYKLYKEGKNIYDISCSRGVRATTIEDHIAALYGSGRDIDVATFGLTDEVVDRIKRIVIGEPGLGLKELYKKLGKECTYMQIKLVTAKLAPNS